MANDLELIVKRALMEIDSNEEKSRRAYALRRHKIYRDGGREFLIESLQTEFNVQSLVEFRLCPINFLKKIVRKKSQLYKTPPIRRVSTSLESDQALVDFYTNELAFDVMMSKANEYYNLHSNCALYVFPKGDFLKLTVIPPHLYSIVPDQFDKSSVRLWAFNNFIEESTVINTDDLPSATGYEGFARDRVVSSQRLIDSQARDLNAKRQFILWTNEFHATFTGDGSVLILDPTKDGDQFLNQIGVAPVVHLQKDTDNEAWAEQGEDAVDLSLLLQRMWTDLATVIKHQGFGQMVVTSEEPPKKMTVGINKVLWLRQVDGKENPTVQYLTADSRISEIKDTMKELLYALLSTNDINPSSAVGTSSGSNFTSGLHAIVEMSDALDAMRSDQPKHRDAEKSIWQIIAKWHNYMLDTGLLREDAKAFGKFSEDFDISISYSDIKPIESQADKLSYIEKGRQLGLITKKDALKVLNPDMTDDEIEDKIEEIGEEMQDVADKVDNMMSDNSQKDNSSNEDQQDSEDGKQEGQV